MKRKFSLFGDYIVKKFEINIEQINDIYTFLNTFQLIVEGAHLLTIYVII